MTLSSSQISQKCKLGQIFRTKTGFIVRRRWSAADSDCCQRLSWRVRAPRCSPNPCVHQKKIEPVACRLGDEQRNMTYSSCASSFHDRTALSRINWLTAERSQQVQYSRRISKRGWGLRQPLLYNYSPVHRKSRPSTRTDSSASDLSAAWWNSTGTEDIRLPRGDCLLPGCGKILASTQSSCRPTLQT